MESAGWRNYRGYFIIARKALFGSRRYDVWRSGQLVETFRDGVAAELHIDALVGRTPGPR